MRLKVAAPLAMMLCVATVLAVVSVLAYQNGTETVGWAKEKQLSSINTMVEMFLREQTRQTVAFAEVLASLPDVGELVAKGDREGLSKVLMPGYRKAVAKYGVESASIVSPPATTVLRLHNPGKFGDDQSGYRRILSFANQTREVQSGLEVSYVVGVRGVAPIFNGLIHVGALEWATGLGPMVAEVKSVTGAEVVVLIKEAALPSDSALRKNESRKFRDLIAVEASDWPYLVKALQEKDVERVNDGSVVTRTVGGVEVGIVKVPLFDFSGKSVGVVIAVKEVSEFSRVLKDALVRLAVAGGLGLVVTAGVVFLIISGLLLRPLERLGQRLAGMAGGDFSTRVEAVGRRDEIGALAASVESVRLDLLRRFPPGSSPKLDTEAASKGAVS